MNKKLIVATALTTLLALPVVGLAFDPGTIPTPNPNLDINDLIGTILTVFWSIIVAIVIVAFILAGFLFITAQGDPGKIAQGRQALIWGIAGIVVIILSFAIVSIVNNAFNF